MTKIIKFPRSTQNKTPLYEDEVETKFKKNYSVMKSLKAFLEEHHLLYVESIGFSQDSNYVRIEILAEPIV